MNLQLSQNLSKTINKYRKVNGDFNKKNQDSLRKWITPELRKSRAGPEHAAGPESTKLSGTKGDRSERPGGNADGLCWPNLERHKHQKDAKQSIRW